MGTELEFIFSLKNNKRLKKNKKRKECFLNKRINVKKKKKTESM